MKPAVSVKGCLFVILSAVIYGCMPLMSKLIYAEGVNPVTLVFLRNVLALPALALMAYRAHGTLSVPRSVLPSVTLISLMGCCVTPFLLFSSYDHISTGTATVFHFVYPAIVVLGGMLVLRERPRAANLISVAICIAGICPPIE